MHNITIIMIRWSYKGIWGCHLSFCLVFMNGLLGSKSLEQLANHEHAALTLNTTKIQGNNWTELQSNLTQN